MSVRKLYRPSWVAWFSLSAHIVWLAVAAYIWNAIGWPWQPRTNASWVTSDVIEQAEQMGRLDLVALALTFLGVILAIGALAGFFMVRSAAMSAAREEAREYCVRRLPDLLSTEVISKALAENPEMLLTAIRRAKAAEPDISATDADAIASQIQPENDDA